MRSVFFITAFNERQKLPIVLAELAACNLPCDEILLIDNGSNDGTEELIRNAGYPYLRFPQNRGVGYGYMTAVDWALDRNFDIIGGLAGNAKMLPSEMHRLLTPLLADEVDYVTGSRFMPGGAAPNLPEFRARSIRLVNQMVRLLTGARVTDATCGYRAMKLDIYQRAAFDWHREWLHAYSFEYYIDAKVFLDGTWRWKEVPVTMRYPPAGQAYSKITPIISWYQMLRPWVIARLDGKGFDRGA